MAFWINITYAAGTFGATVSTLDIFSNYDSYTTAVATGVAKATLVGGYALSVPDGTTSVRVKGTGVCASIYQDITVGGAPTAPTPTPAAPTPTPAAPTPTPEAPTPTPAAPTPTPAAPTPTPAAPTPTPAAPTPTPASYFYYSAEYCGTATPLVVRFTVDQVAFNVFETATAYVCVRLLDVTFGPSFDMDLGDGSTYVGNNCSACPSPPPTPTAAPPTAPEFENWDYEPCTGPSAYGGPVFTFQQGVGLGTPGCKEYAGVTYSLYGGSIGGYPGTPSYTVFYPSDVSCGFCL
jgi:hypothetical protein